MNSSLTSAAGNGGSSRLDAHLSPAAQALYDMVIRHARA